jgi:hypothetical protein
LGKPMRGQGDADCRDAWMLDGNGSLDFLSLWHGKGPNHWHYSKLSQTPPGNFTNNCYSFIPS